MKHKNAKDLARSRQPEGWEQRQSHPGPPQPGTRTSGDSNVSPFCTSPVNLGSAPRTDLGTELNLSKQPSLQTEPIGHEGGYARKTDTRRLPGAAGPSSRPAARGWPALRPLSPASELDGPFTDKRAQGQREGTGPYEDRRPGLPPATVSSEADSFQPSFSWTGLLIYGFASFYHRLFCFFCRAL